MAHCRLKIGNNYMATHHPRITARVDEQTQILLTQAAQLLGMPSINAFVLSAAVEKAKQILIREQTLQLNQADAINLVTALERPEQQHAKLKQAAERYATRQHQAHSN